jgi:hypothetical protein
LTYKLGELGVRAVSQAPEKQVLRLRLASWQGSRGYYFIAHGKKPHVEYGVMTDADLLAAAKQYFGVSDRGKVKSPLPP